MSERIAEFDSADDAWAFRNMKNRMCGADDYDVCGGIQKLYAVIPKIRYAADEPARTYTDPDAE